MAKEKKIKEPIHPMAILGSVVIGIGLIGLIIFNPFIQNFSFFDKFVEFAFLIGEFFNYFINNHIYDLENDIQIINLDSFAELKIAFDSFITQYKQTFILYKFDSYVSTSLRIGNIITIFIILFGFWLKNSYKDISFIKKLLIPISTTIATYFISFGLYVGSILQTSNII